MDLEEAKVARDRITKFFASGRVEEGLKILKQEENHLLPHLRFECYGNLHFYRRELQEAVNNYEAAITMAPDHPIARYQYLVGTQKERQGNFVEAFKRYQNAIEIEPIFLDTYIELGGLLGKVGDFEGAAKCYRDAARHDPGDLAAWQNLKTILARLVSNDPEKYRKELTLAEGMCEKLKKNGAKLPERHIW